MTTSWPLLERFWRRTQPGWVAEGTDSWHEETRELQRLGIATELALQFLYFERPAWEAFRGWIDGRRIEPGDDTPIEDVLDARDLAFWDENGYLVLKQAVSPDECSATRRAIWDFLGADPDDPASWYRPHEAQYGLMLTLFDHPALEQNRRSARVRNAYRQLYGSNAIFKSIDKVSFNPPENASFHFMGSSLHWDVSLEPPIPYQLQGLLYLTDCGPGDGAFHCVPGFHRKLEPWLQSLPQDADPRATAKQELQAIAVPGQAGDFVIWHQALPHCATPNRGLTPRLVQYLTYLPQEAAEIRPWK